MSGHRKDICYEKTYIPTIYQRGVEGKGTKVQFDNFRPLPRKTTQQKMTLDASQ